MRTSRSGHLAALPLLLHAAATVPARLPTRFDRRSPCVPPLPQLDGLVIVGGDDSNTNAAVLVEHLIQQGMKMRIIGVPKTSEQRGPGLGTPLAAPALGDLCFCSGGRHRCLGCLRGWHLHCCRLALSLAGKLQST